MTTPARHTLAIVGAGPIGLEAAAAALERGFDAHVFERGEVGSHPRAWGHVRMFTPWRMNLGPRSQALLARSGWRAPDPEAHPTGDDLVERYLKPLAASPELKARVHTHAQVVHLARRGVLPGDPGPGRREHPFRLMVRDAGGRESYLHAFALIDASGVYGQPNWAGDGGIPARQELYLAPQMAYHLEDVLGAARTRHAGKRTLVVGAGTSAATTVRDLCRLADEEPGTTVLWVTRKPASMLYAAAARDPLPERAALGARARELAQGAHAAVSHAGGSALESLEYNSATHRYRVTLRIGEERRVEEVDRVIANTGFRPDDAIHRELLPAPEMSPGGLREPRTGIEPDFYVLGHKSWHGDPGFLLETGYRQVAEVVEKLSLDLGVGSGRT